jgi:N-acetylglucosamine-6-sulfatase
MRPNVLRLGLSLVLLLGPSIIVSASPQAVSAAPSKPNVVIILTDDQRYDTLWAMPHVQKDLVGKGMQFNQGFVVNSLCCPSRTSILTGNYSHTTQVWKDSPPYGGFQTFLDTGDDQSTLATWLHRDGYRTALFGKYLNGYYDQASAGYIPPGWDQWNAFDRASYYNYRLFVHNNLRQFGSHPSDYSTGVLANEATSFIQNTKSPFFMYFAPYAPHRPAVPSNQFDHRFKGIKPWHPKSYDEHDVSDKPNYISKDITPFDAARNKAIQRFRRRQYQTLLSADQAVGNIVNTLKDTGQLDNTIIFFMSDNGIAWGENRWTSKKVPYEPSIRIPYVVRYDPLTHSTNKVDQTDMVLNIDVAPTIVQLAGAKAPSMDGQSLVPLLDGSADTWRTDFLIEHMSKNQKQAPPTYCAVRSEQYIYVYYATGEEELYNLQQDPEELRNQVNNPNLDLVRTTMQSRLKDLCNPHPPGLHIHSGL